MDAPIADVAGLVAALAAIVTAIATYMQARLAWTRLHEGTPPYLLNDQYRHVRTLALGSSALALVAAVVLLSQGLPRWATIVVVCILGLTTISLGTVIGYSTAQRSRPGRIPIDAQHLEGHWFGTFGNAYFTVEGSHVKAVYDYMDGRILGTIHEGVFDGWWNELPSRQPPDHAGSVYFEMSREDKGHLRLDGGWLHGTDGNWMIWQLTEVDKTIPAAAQVKLEDSSTFTMG